MKTVKEDNSIYTWGSVWNIKTLWHLVGTALIFTFTFYLIYWLKLEDELQLPKLFAGVATFTLAYAVEYYQMRISKAKIDVTDLCTALAAILIMAWVL